MSKIRSPIVGFLFKHLAYQISNMRIFIQSLEPQKKALRFGSKNFKIRFIKSLNRSFSEMDLRYGEERRQSTVQTFRKNVKKLENLVHKKTE